MPLPPPLPLLLPSSVALLFAGVEEYFKILLAELDGGKANLFLAELCCSK